METHVDLSHSLVRRRPSAPRNERMAVTLAASSIAAFLGAALALVGGAIGPQVYLALAGLSTAVFTLAVVRLR